MPLGSCEPVRFRASNPDGWWLKWAKEMMQPGRDVAFGASILSGIQNAATLGEPAKSDLSEEPNANSALSNDTSLTVARTTESPGLVAGKAVGTSPPTNDEGPRGSSELTAGTESENASRSKESIKGEAQGVDDEGGDEEEKDDGDNGEESEIKGENEVGGGEVEQAKPALSQGISCPHLLREIF
jgi:hypothetical protein